MTLPLTARTNIRTMGILLIINAGILAVVFLIPFNSDLDLYHSMGLELTRGHLPYIGSWDNNFPGIIYFHALAILLFGKGYIGFRILDVLVHLATASCIFAIASRYMRPLYAMLGATLNSLYYVGGSFWLAGQKDGFATFFIVLSAFFFLNSLRNRSIRPILASGIATGIAISFRPTFILFALSIAALLLVERRNLKGMLSFFAGVSIPWIVILLPYTMIPGGFYQFYESTIDLNLNVYGQLRAPYNWIGLLRHPLVFCALFSLLPGRRVASYRKIPSIVRWLMLLFLASAAINIAAMGKYLVYHFDPLFAIVAPMAARGIENVTSYFRFLTLRVIVAGPVALVLFRLLYPFDLLHNFRDAIEAGDRHPVHRVWEKVKNNTDFGLAREEEIADYLERRTNPSDRIEIVSTMSALRWRIDRRETSRFTTMYAYGMRLPGQNFIPFELECQQEILDSMKSVVPRYLLLATEPTGLNMLNSKTPEACFMAIPGMEDLLKSNYKIDTVIGRFNIFRRNS
jgi:Dolichyl-phosphate-mannose-protein mannosyltransferase